MHAIATSSSARLRTAGPPPAPLLAVAAGAGALVLALWVTVAVHSPADLDQDVYNTVHGTRGSTETAFARHLTAIGNGVPLVLLLAAMCLWSWFAWRRWEPTLVSTMALFLAAVVEKVIKVAVGRSRPPAPGWLSTAEGNSFPSGHTTMATAAYLTLAMCVAVLLPVVWARVVVMMAGVALALGVGWTRVELGVHWPTDVLAGWAIGAGAACVALACWRLAPPTLRP